MSERELGSVGCGWSARDYAENRREDGLTILILGRNQRIFLPHALRSAFDALGFLGAADIVAEIVVIDDASIDGSQKLLRSVQALYDEPRLRILCLSVGVGPAKLRGMGLRASAYRHVCLMNAHNELLSANLPVFVRSASDTGAAMVYGNVVDKRGGEVAGVRSNMPVVPGVAKSRRVDGFSIVDLEKLDDPDGAAATTSAGDTEGWELALRLLDGERDVVFVPVVLGYRHERGTVGELRSAGVPSRRVSRRAEEKERDVQRPARIYHPEVGFLDE